MATHIASVPMMSAAVASARACLDVLRGAAVLIEDNKGALVQMLSGGRGDGAAATGEQELAMLQSLGRHVSEVIELCTSTAKTSPPAIGGSAASSQLAEGLAGVRDAIEVTDINIKRHRGQDMQGEQRRPHHHHSAAATTFRQFSISDSAKVTVTSTAELLLHMMGYLGGGNEEVCARREELGRMALVCRAWRDAAHSETLWRPLALELIPRLADEDSRVTQEELQVNALGSYRQYLVQCGQLTGGIRLQDGNVWAHELMLQCEMWTEEGCCIFSTEREVEVEEVDERLHIRAYDRGPLFRMSEDHGTQPAQMAVESVGMGLYVRIIGHHKRMGRKMLLYGDHLTVHEVIQDDDAHFHMLSDQCRFLSTLYGPDSIEGRVGFTLEATGGVNGDGEEHTRWKVACAFMRFDTTDEVSVGRLIWSVSH